MVTSFVSIFPIAMIHFVLCAYERHPKVSLDSKKYIHNPLEV